MHRRGSPPGGRARKDLERTYDFASSTHSRLPRLSSKFLVVPRSPYAHPVRIVRGLYLYWESVELADRLIEENYEKKCRDLAHSDKNPRVCAGRNTLKESGRCVRHHAGQNQVILLPGGRHPLT